MGPLATFRRRVVAPFLLAEAPSGELSLGAGIGLFVALLPIVGQIPLTPVLWAVCRPLARLRFNLPVALGMVLLISWPVQVPLFYLYLLSGEALLGAAGFDPALGSHSFRAAMAGLAAAPWPQWFERAGHLIAVALERYTMPLGIGGVAWAVPLGKGGVGRDGMDLDPPAARWEGGT